MKTNNYEEFEEKYHRTKDYEQYRSALQTIPFVNQQRNMDVFSKIDTNAFARIDDNTYKEIENFPEYDYNNSIAYEMLIRTYRYKQLHYDNSLTSDEKIKAYDKLGVDSQEVYRFILKKSNSLYSTNQSITKNIFDSYCDLTIGDVSEGINKLIDFYFRRDQIYTLVKYDKDAFGLTRDIHYEVCHGMTPIY